MQKIIFLILLTFLLIPATVAQDLSEKHRKKLERVQDSEKREKLFQKYWKKDSVRYHKKIDNLISGKKDSLQQLLSPVKTDSTWKEHAAGQVIQSLEDTLNIAVPDIRLDISAIDDAKGKGIELAEDKLQMELPPTDSTALGNYVRDKSMERLEQEIGTEIPEMDSASVKNHIKNIAVDNLEKELGTELPEISLDSTMLPKVRDEAIRRGEERLMERDEFSALDGMGEDSELSQLMDQKETFEQSQDQIRQLAQQELKQQMTSRARKFITENADKIQQVQSKMGEMKKIYSYLPNSNDLSTARKRTSLEGEPLYKRLFLGGNFNISETNPVAVDFSPMLGYRINKLFKAGFTVMYRTSFGADKSGIYKGDDNTYGYSLFANHMVFRNFFGYLEGERIRKTNTFPNETFERSWKQSLLVGIGRKFSVTKWLDMQALILFNVLHRNMESPYESPVVFKTGFKINK